VKEMKKICLGCGTIFEVKESPKFCSEECKGKFQQSGLDWIKTSTPERRVYPPK
jgi:rRNA maturation endonuclease Nob1